MDEADRGDDAGVGWAGPAVLTGAWLHAVNSEAAAALTLADEIAATAERDGDARLRAEAHFVAALAHVNVADSDSCLARIDLALACPGLGAARGFRAAARTVQGAALLAMNRLDEALEALYQAEGSLDRIREPGPREANAYANIGLCRSRAQLFESADAAYDKAARITGALGMPQGSDLHGRAENLMFWGMRLEHLGKRREAALQFAAAGRLFARALAEPRDRSYDAEQDVAVIGAVLAAHRPLSRTPRVGALAALARAREAAARSSLPEAGPWLAQATAAVLLCLGHADTALEGMRHVDDPSAGLWRTLEADRLFTVGACQEAGGDPGAALHSYRALHRHYDEAAWRGREARASAARARVERARLATEAQRLAQDTLTDPLTGLPNRRRLDLEMGRLQRRADDLPLSLAVIDIDEFKQVNDVHGHSVGDDVLTAVGVLLRRECRAVDLVARYAGDEFVLLLPGLDAVGADALRRRLDAALATQRWDELAPGLRVTVTIGTATTDTSPVPVDLFDRADADLRSRKQARGRVPAQRSFAASTAS